MKLNFKALILILIIVMNQTLSSATHFKRMKNSLQRRRRSHRMSSSSKAQVKANSKFLPLIFAAVTLALYVTQKVMEHYTLKLNEERLKLMNRQHEMNKNSLKFLKRMEMEHCSSAKIYLAINRYLKFTNQLNYVFKSNLAEVMTNQEVKDKEKDKEIMHKFKQAHESIQEKSFEVIERMDNYVNKICNQKSIYGLLEEEDNILDQKITQLKEKVKETSGTLFNGIFAKIKEIVQIAVQDPVKLKDSFKTVSVDNTEITMPSSQFTLATVHYNALGITENLQEELQKEHEMGAIKAFECIAIIFSALEKVTKHASKYVTLPALIGKLFNVVSLTMKWASAFLKWRIAKKNKKEDEIDSALDNLIQATKPVLLAILEMIFAPIVDLMIQTVDSIIAGIGMIKAKNNLKKQIMKGDLYNRLRQNSVRTSERYNKYNMCQLSADTLINVNILMEETGLSRDNPNAKLENKDLEVQELQKEHYFDLLKKSPGIKVSLEKDLSVLCKNNLQLCSRSLNIPQNDNDFLLAGNQVELKKKAIYGPYSDITIANFYSEVSILIQLGYEPIDLNFDSEDSFPKIFGCRKCSNRVVINAYIVDNPSDLNIKSDEKCNRYFDSAVCLTSAIQTIRLNLSKQLILETVDVNKVNSHFYPAVNRIFVNGNTFNKFSTKIGIYDEKTGNYFKCASEALKNQKFIFCEGENNFMNFEIDEKKMNIIRLSDSPLEEENTKAIFLEYKFQINAYEYARVYGSNFISFVLANDTPKISTLIYNFPTKKKEPLKYELLLKDQSVQPEAENILVDPLKYNWVSLKFEGDQMEKLFQKYFSDISIKEIGMYRLNTDPEPKKHATLNMFSMSPFSVPEHKNTDKDLVNASTLCNTMVNNCFTTESTIDESTDLDKLSGPIWSNLISSNKKPQLVQPEESLCMYDLKNKYSICQMDKFNGKNCLFSPKETSPNMPSCFKDGKQTYELKDSTTYIVMLGKSLFENVSSYSSIFNSYVLGRNRFIHSEFHDQGDYIWFLATQFSVRDKLFPFYNIIEGTKESLYETNFKLQTNKYEDFQLVDLIKDFKPNSSIFFRRKFKHSTKGNKMYRKVLVENGKIKEVLEPYGPGIKKYYYIQYTDMENLDQYYVTNYRDANIIGFEKISQIRSRKGMKVIVWVLVDYRLTVNLKDKNNDAGEVEEKGLCNKAAQETKVALPLHKEEGVITDFYLYKDTDNLNSHSNPCSLQGTGSNALVLYDDYVPDIKTTSFDIRQGTMSFLFVYFCQIRGKRSNEKGFISYKKPPVIIEDSSEKSFNKIFPDYSCSLPSNLLPSNITYDLGAGLGSTYRLCVHFTIDQTDPGIANFYVYPKNNNKNCTTDNKHLSIFITDENYECICNDLNAGRTGPSVYICYEKGT